MYKWRQYLTCVLQGERLRVTLDVTGGTLAFFGVDEASVVRIVNFPLQQIFEAAVVDAASMLTRVRFVPASTLAVLVHMYRMCRFRKLTFPLLWCCWLFWFVNP